jgi:hypothetical protein
MSMHTPSENDDRRTRPSEQGPTGNAASDSADTTARYEPPSVTPLGSLPASTGMPLSLPPTPGR